MEIESGSESSVRSLQHTERSPERRGETKNPSVPAQPLPDAPAARLTEMQSTAEVLKPQRPVAEAPVAQGPVARDPAAEAAERVEGSGAEALVAERPLPESAAERSTQVIAVDSRVSRDAAQLSGEVEGTGDSQELERNVREAVNNLAQRTSQQVRSQSELARSAQANLVAERALASLQ